MIAEGVTGFEINFPGGRILKIGIEKPGRIPVTQNVFTTAGHLPFKAVIHTVGPRMGERRGIIPRQALQGRCTKVKFFLKKSEKQFTIVSQGLQAFGLKLD